MKALQKNYGPAEFQNPDEHLCKVKQKGSVQEYLQEFAKRTALVQNWPEHCLLGVFLSGLKQELKPDVRIHKPRSVYKAMSLALEFEIIAPTRGPKGGNWALSTRPMAQPTLPPRDFAQPLSAITATSQPRAMPQTPSLSTPLLPWEAENQFRQEKGLCFRCNERFSPGHRGKITSFSLMELIDNADQLKRRNPRR